MKKVLLEYHSNEHCHVDFVVYETSKTLVIDYYVNITGKTVGKSYFHKSDFARIHEIKKILNYWRGNPLTIMAILLDEFFCEGYRNELYVVF